MTTDGYRTPGRAVDETEVEVARIREAEETVRNRDALKAKAADDRRERFWTFISHDGSMFVMGATILLSLGILGTIVIMYAHWRIYR